MIIIITNKAVFISELKVFYL